MKKCLKKDIIIVKYKKLTQKGFESQKIMKQEIISFVNNIKTQTGLTLSVYDNQNKPIVGENDINLSIPLLANGQIYAKGNKTYFSLNFMGEEHVASLNGVGEQVNSFAFLISQLAQTSSQEISKGDFLLKLLTGNVEGLAVKKLIKKFSLVDKPLFTMILVTDYQNKQELIDFVNSYNTDGDLAFLTNDDRVVLIKLCNESIDDYVSCTEYAEFLVRSIYEEMGVKIKIGVGRIVEGLEKLNESYLQAISTVDMMDVLQEGGEVHTYKEYALIKILGEMPKNKINYYLNFLLDSKSKEVLEDQEIIKTADCFLENNLNASETSRKMYLHRNTLNYRLDKIEKATGLNIRKFSDALTYRLITILAKLTR